MYQSDVNKHWWNKKAKLLNLAFLFSTESLLRWLSYHFIDLTKSTSIIDWLIFGVFFGTKGQVARDRSPGPRYNTLFLWLIPGDLYSASPQRQFNTLPNLYSRVALHNSYPNVCVPSREAVYTFFMVFGMTWAGHEPTIHCMRGGHQLVSKYLNYYKRMSKVLLI